MYPIRYDFNVDPDAENGGCNQSINDSSVKLGAVLIAAPALPCLILNLVGLLSALIFVCTKKNTFFLRLYIYLLTVVTICVGGYSAYFLIYVWPKSDGLCRILHSVVEYCIAMEKMFVFSINVILIYEVSSSFKLSHHNVIAEKLPRSSRKCLEIVFLALNFGIPAVAFSTFLAIEQKPGLCFVTVRHSVECFFGKGFVEKEYLTFEVAPLLLNSCLSALCVSLLLIWLCWMRRRLLLKSRIKIVIKEIGVWLGFLVGYCVVGVIIEATHISGSFGIEYIEFIFVPLFHSCIPIAFFVYMCISLCPSRKKKKEVDHKAVRNTIQTAGLRTAPASTRVSLPTDTAAHAPNFLSPSDEFTEASPLLS